ncbi:hypothetical protein [Xanthomonas citri]|uniref:hypothetical protein n=1 Tax=Xanthomonas citri TaxID=346 RepID=UPI001F429937|nr:hypothetical protein [Xanthomonas citri]
MRGVARGGKGTNDAFLIFLFAQAFGISTHYQPVHPLIPEYQAVLEHWRSTDAAAFQAAMQAAADWHIARSKDGTERNTYEFEKDIDRVYPAELLAVRHCASATACRISTPAIC